MTVHVHGLRRPGAGYLLGMLVLGSPGPALADGGEDDLCVAAGVDRYFVPHEPRQAILGQYVGSAPTRVRRIDPGRGKRLPDHLGTIGAVLTEGLPGPLAGDE